MAARAGSPRWRGPGDGRVMQGDQPLPLGHVVQRSDWPDRIEISCRECDYCLTLRGTDAGRWAALAAHTHEYATNPGNQI